MKRIPYILLISVLFTACTNEIEVVEETFADGKPKVIVIYREEGGEKVKAGYRELYENGQTRIKGDYKDGKRDGRWFSWHENGNTWSTVNYDVGIRKGETRIYYKSGELHIRGQFKDDLASGIWEWHNRKGEVIDQVDYDEKRKRNK